jgi:hypothetical protein
MKRQASASANCPAAKRGGVGSSGQPGVNVVPSGGHGGPGLSCGSMDDARNAPTSGSQARDPSQPVASWISQDASSSPLKDSGCGSQLGPTTLEALAYVASCAERVAVPGEHFLRVPAPAPADDPVSSRPSGWVQDPPIGKAVEAQAAAKPAGTVDALPALLPGSVRESNPYHEIVDRCLSLACLDGAAELLDTILKCPRSAWTTPGVVLAFVKVLLRDGVDAGTSRGPLGMHRRAPNVIAFLGHCLTKSVDGERQAVLADLQPVTAELCSLLIDVSGRAACVKPCGACVEEPAGSTTPQEGPCQCGTVTGVMALGVLKALGLWGERCAPNAVWSLRSHDRNELPSVVPLITALLKCRLPKLQMSAVSLMRALLTQDDYPAAAALEHAMQLPQVFRALLARSRVDAMHVAFSLLRKRESAEAVVAAGLSSVILAAHAAAELSTADALALLTEMVARVPHPRVLTASVSFVTRNARTALCATTPVMAVDMTHFIRRLVLKRDFSTLCTLENANLLDLLGDRVLITCTRNQHDRVILFTQTLCSLLFSGLPANRLVNRDMSRFHDLAAVLTTAPRFVVACSGARLAATVVMRERLFGRGAECQHRLASLGVLDAVLCLLLTLPTLTAVDLQEVLALVVCISALCVDNAALSAPLAHDKRLNAKLKQIIKTASPGPLSAGYAHHHRLMAECVALGQRLAGAGKRVPAPDGVAFAPTKPGAGAQPTGLSSCAETPTPPCPPDEPMRNAQHLQIRPKRLMAHPFCA